LFMVLFAIERETGLPLVLALTGALARTLAEQMGWLFLLFQVVTAVVVAPFERPALWLLGKLSPPHAAETLGRPRFIYDQALEHPPTALDLVEREQAGLTGRLPQLLDSVLEPGPGPAPRATLLAAANSVELAVGHFVTDLLSRGCDRPSMERAVMLQNRNVLLVSLRETVGEFATAVELATRPGAEDSLAPMLLRLTEALHLLLLQLNDALTSEDGDDLALLRVMSGDRSEMMDQLRRRTVLAEPGLGAAGHDLLFRVTALFERAVWLVRRQALLLGEVTVAAAAE
jgi:phosphate:Na+ symporter